MDTLDLNNLPEADLIDELADHITDGSKTGLRFINHPYVNTIYTPSLNALYNLNYLGKKKAVDEARTDSEWSRFIFLHERPYRLHALIELVAEHDSAAADENIVSCVARNIIVQNLHDVYIDSEGTHLNRELWQELFERLPRAHRNTNGLPKKVILYRGTDIATGKDRGFSWTLNKEKAQWFADRWEKGGHVRALEVLRDGIMLYTDDRGESECVYFGPLA